MRRLALASLLFASTLFAGPVGYRVIDRYDASRPFWMPRDLEGKPRSGERARPMRVSVWYPAQSSSAPAMTLGEYIDLMGAEDRIVPIGDEQKRAGRTALYGFQFLRGITPEQRAKLEAFPTLAQRDAPAAPGKFPLILYSLGSAAVAHGAPELLASHGYVVMQMPRLGFFAGMPPDAPTDTDAKVRDTEFLLQVARDFPSADIHNLGTIGFSAGGRWALSMAMKNPDVRAVVSLDSVMLFNDAAGRNMRTLPYFDLDAVRVPVLHMIRRTWVPQEDAAMWNALRYAERTALVFEDPRLDHFDFQSIGYESTLAGLRADAANGIASTYESVNRITLAFLDAHLKNDAQARASFEAALPAGITALRTPAAKAPTQLADVMNAIAEGSIEAAVKAVRAGGAGALPENVINLAGYNLLGSGRTADAVQMFALNVEAYPNSANAYDSLADAYVAAGDRAKASELAKKALALLEADTVTAAERKQAIRASIEQKLGGAR